MIDELGLEKSATLDQGKMAKVSRNPFEKDGNEFRRDIPDQPIICYENRLINANNDENSRVLII